MAIEAAGLTVTTFAETPDLLGSVFTPEIQSGVPEFMRHEPIAQLYYGVGALTYYRVVAVDPGQPDQPIARAFSVPFAFGTSGRDELPDGGWDAVIGWADEDRRTGSPATAVSALEILVAKVSHGFALDSLLGGAGFEPSVRLVRQGCDR